MRNSVLTGSLLQAKLSRILMMLGLCWLLAGPVQAGEPALIDLREASSRNGAISLEGSWDFYWQRFVDPFDLAAVPDEQWPVGRGWKSAESRRPGMGYASYRIRIKGLEYHEDGYELRLPYILSAWRLAMYPEKEPHRIIRSQLGEPGVDASSNQPRTLTTTVSFRPSEPEEVWILTLHIACFEHSNGGLRSVPVVAPGQQLSRQWRRQMDSELFCAGILFIMFLYNLMLFVRRPEDKASLIGALAILSIALRSVATSNLLYYLADRNGKDILEWNHVFEYLTLTGSGILFSYFLQLTFKPAAYPRLLKTAAWASSPLLVATLVLSADLYPRLLPVYQLTTAFFIGLGLWVIVRAYMLRLDGSRTVFMGGLFILVSFVYDILVYYRIFPLPYTLQYATVVYVFLGSETLAQQFAKAFRTAEKLQKDLKQEVFKQTAEIKQIMASIPQGIFTLGPSLCIEGQYSKHLEFILQTEFLEGQEAIPLLFAQSNIDAEQVSMLRSALLASMGEDLLIWDFNQHCLIHEFQINRPKLGLRIFELDWHPIANASQCIEQILVTLRDVTDWRSLQEANRQREVELNLLLELVPISEGRWQDFVRQGQELLGKAEGKDQSLRTTTLALHTLKGLARSIGCRHLSTSIHEVEERLRASVQFDEDLQQDVKHLSQLLKRYETLWSEKLKRGSHSKPSDNQSELLEELAWQRQQLNALNPVAPHMQGLLEALDNYIQESLYVPLFDLLREVTEEMAPLAKDLGRIPPELQLEGFDPWVHQRTARILRMALVHLIRNALDHGLESPDERQAMGKNPRGLICWRVTVKGRKVFITCRDDGRGLDLPALISKASSMGYSQRDLEALPHGITDAIFISGLSSRDRANEVSGRGVGMDALRSMIEEAGGQVWAELLTPAAPLNEPQPFHTVIEIPAQHCLKVGDDVLLAAGF